jgi:ornithine decarboxylase
MTQVSDYYQAETFARFKAFADRRETPFLLMDLAIVQQHFAELREHFPYAKIYYAVKANPAAEIIRLLRDQGGYFDVASVYELEKVLALGCDPARIGYGNTIKKRKDIAAFYARGVRLFVSDSEADLRNIAELAPGAKVTIRILTEGDQTSDWPLSRKFGCQTDMAMDLLVLSRELGLQPYGVSFHVGSQQRDIGAWDAAIDKVRVIFRRLRNENGIQLKMINLGGGFPANYVARTHDIATYAREITRFLHEDFADEMPEIIIEPGRSLVANAGVLVCEVVLISRKSSTALNRWVFTDVGKFSGLIETMDEAIKYPLYCEREGPGEEVILAGPTCDSVDILYEKYRYTLSSDLRIGDRLYWFSTGAYTSSYSSIEFNGFPPLESYFV